MKIKELLETPRIIIDDVNVSFKATKLDYEGVVVTGNFICSSTHITSLKGSPKEVRGNFSCTNTRIKSLEGAPEYVGQTVFCDQTGITSLEGAPSYIGFNLLCWNTKITSLHNIHKQIKHISEGLHISNTVKSHVLGAMMIKGLQKIDFAFGSRKQKKVQAIINKHLKGDRDIHACQEELIEAGFSEYARL